MRLRFFVQKITPIFGFAVLALVLVAEVYAAPTLARLSFWVPQERMTEFEIAYQEKVVPILKKHGLIEYSEPARSSLEGIFSRLFELKNPAEVVDRRDTLLEDAEWEEVLQDLGAAFGTTRADGLIEYMFRHYSTPAGTGNVIPAGSGEIIYSGPGHGHWHQYNVTDGLASGTVGEIYQDREGNFWFGTSGGVTRYDGVNFTTFTTKDGLAHNQVGPILQDKDGYIWFGTGSVLTRGGRGVSRYDGTTFTTFTTKDGLADNTVLSIIQDQENYLWFGTYGGVSRYNGQGFTTFTTKDGLANNWVTRMFQDKDGHLWFGTYFNGVSKYDGQSFITLNIEDGLAHNMIASIYQDKEGYLWFGTYEGVSRYDGQNFTTFTIKDGLVGNTVPAILQDKEGNLWFGTYEGGVSRYDGQKFITPDELKSYQVWSILQDKDGNLWFGTGGNGVIRYDDVTFTTFTTQDGLPPNIGSILQDKEDNLWFRSYGGVIRYDGKSFTNLTTKDGLASNYVRSILQDREGNLWFGTTDSGVSRYDGQNFTTFTKRDGLTGNFGLLTFQDKEGYFWFGVFDHGGVSRYDGHQFITFTKEDGLAGNRLNSILQDRDGNLWFATTEGLSRYDGKSFTNFTTEDGLPDNSVGRIFQDREGNLWFPTGGNGVTRYDGYQFITLTKEYGLADNWVWAIFQDKEGHFWFGSSSGIVNRYDGQVFQTLTHHDGLPGGSVGSIFQDREGNIWFTTVNGIVRYRQPTPSPPPVFIDAVVADKRHKDVSEITITSNVGLVAFEFHGNSFKTRPEAMIYRYRLTGHDADWNNTNSRRVEYQELPRGNYTFEVIAVDRDLVYSERPASVKLKVVPPFYLRASFLAPTVGLGAILLAASIIFATALVKHRRRIRAYERVAVQELQEANRVQMSLMPEKAPPIEAVEIAGKCLPANTVSGDFFDYLEGKRDNEIALVVADVTGKAMKGAMNAVMVDGILHSVAKGQEKLSPAFLLSELNDVLKARMEQDMNVTMVIGVIDVETKTLTIANAAHHAHPILRRDNEIRILRTGGLPLGMRAGVEYSAEQFSLQSNDVLIFMTDGIIEAHNNEGQQYSESGRLEEAILKITLDISAESIVEAILNDVMTFSGDKTQRDDDMTVVVAKIQ